jgi:hypothetical protein
MSRNKFFSSNTLDPYDNVPVRKEKKLNRRDYDVPFDNTNGYTLVRAPKARKEKRNQNFGSNVQPQYSYNTPPPQQSQFQAYNQFQNYQTQQQKMLILEDEHGHEITRIHPTDNSGPSMGPLPQPVYPNYPQPYYHHLPPPQPYIQPIHYPMVHHAPANSQGKMLILEDENGHEITRIHPTGEQPQPQIISQPQIMPQPGYHVLHPGPTWYH